ncbi:MAG: response regulator [Candidatus Omnitrophota bacterium]|jgi:DNA-binding response OmpR family regulator
MPAKRILIIDDDIELCEELIDLLTDQGYFTEFCHDPVEGESLIRAGGFDIILLDFKMPSIGGLEILRKLKADNIKKRIFIFSGRPSVEKELKESGLTETISGVIAKPIDFNTFLNKIKES